MSEPTFGQRCIVILRDAKRENPNLSWERVAEIIDTQLKLLPTEARPKVTKKEIQSALFDALVKACGCKTDEMSPDAQRTAAVALSQIRAVTPDVTPDEFIRRARLYRNKYRDAALTPKALANHWYEFGGGSNRKEQPKLDVYQEPPGWDKIAQRLFGSDIAGQMIERGWGDLATTLRADIWRAAS